MRQIQNEMGPGGADGALRARRDEAERLAYFRYIARRGRQSANPVRVRF